MANATSIYQLNRLELFVVGATLIRSFAEFKSRQLAGEVDGSYNVDGSVGSKREVEQRLEEVVLQANEKLLRNSWKQLRQS